MKKLRIWWIPNPPRKPFTREVKDIDEAKIFLNLLADYDLYLGDEIIFANACGLESTETGEWTGEEYYDEQGRDILEIMDL